MVIKTFKCIPILKDEESDNGIAHEMGITGDKSAHGGGSQIGILYKAMIVYSMTILELAFFPHTMPCYKYMYRIFRI